MDNFDFEITKLQDGPAPQTTPEDIQAILRATNKHPELFLSGEYKYEIVDKNTGTVTLLKTGKSTRKRKYKIEVSIVDLATGDIGPQKADLWLRDSWGNIHDIAKAFSNIVGKISVRGTGLKGNKINAGKFTGPSILVYRVTRLP